MSVKKLPLAWFQFVPPVYTSILLKNVLSAVVTKPAIRVGIFSSAGIGGGGGLLGSAGRSCLHPDNKPVENRRKSNRHLIHKVWRDVKMVKIIDIEKI
jgi:hypothetical protein